jgi:hypothetical protein
MTVSERAGAGGTDRLPDEVVNDLLADDGCHRVLSCLAARGEPTAVEDLARSVAAREAGVSTEAVDEATVATHREDLFQQYLPRLTPTGVVSYDSLLGTVALATSDERILSALE